MIPLLVSPVNIARAVLIYKAGLAIAHSHPGVASGLRNRCAGQVPATRIAHEWNPRPIQQANRTARHIPQRHPPAIPENHLPAALRRPATLHRGNQHRQHARVRLAQLCLCRANQRNRQAYPCHPPFHARNVPPRRLPCQKATS